MSSLPETMRAARLHRPAGAGGAAEVRVDEVAVPEPGPRDVLVEIRACGVCASDLHVVQGVTPHGPELPQVLGHEPAGVVAAVGGAVESWLPGDRVAMLMGRPCRDCAYCESGRENLCRDLRIPGVDAHGAQAQYALADTDSLIPVPSGVTFEQAAILTDAVATPYHALKRGGVGDGVVCAVFGLGGLGMHAVQLAKLAGCRVIGVDLDPVNLERAPEWGADEVVDASDGKPARAVRALTDGGVDRSFEFVGAVESIDQAVKCLKPGGRTTVVGLHPARLELLPAALFVAQELEIVGSFGSTPQDINELMDLLEAGRLDLTRSITHRLGLDDFPRALELLETREEHPIRIVVDHDAAG